MTTRLPALLALSSLAACAAEVDTTYVDGAIRAVDDMPIVGAAICVAEHPEIPCAITAGDGGFLIEGIPVDEDVTITYEAEGFLPYRVMYGAADVHPRLTTKVFREHEVVGVHAAHGVEVDPNAGMIIVTSRATSATASYFAQPGTVFRVSGGHEPVYVSRHGVPDTSLEATTEGGSAFVVNLPAGDYEIEFDNPDFDCAPFHAWASGRANVILARVIPGSMTFVSQVCAEARAE